MSGDKPLVGVIMGSTSDSDVMKGCMEVLRELDIPHEVRALSAHRTPDLSREYAVSAADRGIQVIIAGAGWAAHLAGLGWIGPSCLLNRAVGHIQSLCFPQARHRRSRSERRELPHAGVPGVNLVHPRCLRPSTYLIRRTPGGGDAKLGNEVAMRLKVR